MLQLSLFLDATTFHGHRIIDNDVVLARYFRLGIANGALALGFLEFFLPDLAYFLRRLILNCFSWKNFFLVAEKTI